MMENLTSKFIDGALNLANAAKDNAGKAFDEMVKAGKISKEEGQKLYNEFMTKFETNAGEYNKKFKLEVVKIVEELGFIRKQQFEELEERLKKVEIYLNEIAKKEKK